MTLLEIWNNFTSFVSEAWWWLINADLTEGLKNLGVLILVISAYFIISYTLKAALNSYNAKLTLLYEKHPNILSRACSTSGTVCLFFLVLFIASLFGILNNYLWLFFILFVLSLLVYRMLLKPDNETKEAID